jgi:hypothetical protein
MIEPFGIDHWKITTTVSIVWDDNNGVLTMCKNDYPNMTPRSKHIAVKYHWFCEHLKPGEMEMKRIDTALQKADIFTKGLPFNRGPTSQTMQFTLCQMAPKQ